MKYAFYTLSGARYMIDLSNMTWKRDGTESNQEVVAGIYVKQGTLYEQPHITIGHRASIRVGPSRDDYIVCTAIQRIELLQSCEDCG